VNEYRAYLIGYDGHISSFRALVCENDTDATVWAKQLVDNHDVELWSGARLVIRLSAAAKPDAISHEVMIDGRMVPRSEVGGTIRRGKP
jgi:hypothetical protein